MGIVCFCRICLVVSLGIASLAFAKGKESESWKSFQSAKDRSPAEILTDYSYAGYEHGEKGIPDVQGPVFKVTDYGAKADDAISDEDAIRKAVAAAESAGGGVVLFPAGKFLVFVDRFTAASIRIGKSGVVIRLSLIHISEPTRPY